MPYFLVELYLDGYETEEEAELACIDFMEQELDMTASSVEVTAIPEGFELNPSETNPLAMIQAFEEVYRRWVARERAFYAQTAPCTADAAKGFERYATRVRRKFFEAACLEVHRSEV